MEEKDRISIQPFWTEDRQNLRVFNDPETGHPLIATYEMHSEEEIIVHRSIPGTLLTGFHICLDSNQPVYAAGTVVKVTDVPMHSVRSIFGCHMYPGMFTKIFGVSNKELPPDGIWLDEIVPTGTLAEEVRSATTQDARAEIVYRFILKNLAQRKRKDFTLPVYLADQILKNPGMLSVEDLAADTSYCPRYLQQVMQDNIGISPKAAINNARLQKALWLLLTTSLSLTEIAHESGYFDQAHFVHSFREVMGCTPRQFHRKQVEATF